MPPSSASYHLELPLASVVSNYSVSKLISFIRISEIDSIPLNPDPLGLNPTVLIGSKHLVGNSPTSDKAEGPNFFLPLSQVELRSTRYSAETFWNQELLLVRAPVAYLTLLAGIQDLLWQKAQRPP